MDEARRQLRRGGVRGLELRYEEIVDRPADGLARLAAFCGLSPGAALLAEAAAAVDGRVVHRRVGTARIERGSIAQRTVAE